MDRTLVALNRHHHQVGGNWVAGWSEVTPTSGSRLFAKDFPGNVMMEDVKFVSHPGFYYGCSHTGSLGFSEGVIVDESHRLQEVVAVKFDGRQFVRRDTGAVVTECRRLALTNTGAYAQFCSDQVPAPVPAPAIVPPPLEKPRTRSPLNRLCGLVRG